MGFGPATEPTLKTALCQICTLVRRMINTEDVLSLGDTQETSLGVGLLKEIIAGKKEFIGRSYETCHFQRRNSAVHFLLRR